MKRILFSLAILLGAVSAHAYDNNVPKLTLNASGTLLKPADELQLTLGVITLSETAEKVLQENSDKMDAIIHELERVGLDPDDYETAQFSINPTYTICPKNPPENWKRAIIGYEVSNSIQIHTQKLDLAGKIIDVANKAGANSISGLHFTLHSSRDHWQEAITLAAQNAVQDAEAIAQATGVRLLRVLSISLNNTQIHAPRMDLACFAKEACGTAAPPIQPGDVGLTAHISIVYEIH